VPKLSHSHLCQRHDDTALPFLRQRLPHRRGRTFAHCAIQASAPGRSALEIRPSVIRRISSTYQRCCEWYIENSFDELKNQWGWGGFTTRDLKRCRLMAGCVALVFNWWNLFVRLADPDHHREAITSRPLLLQAIGRQTRHAGRTTITITSSHGEHNRARQALTRIAGFFAELRKTAEQLTSLERWYRILSEALKKFLRGRILIPPRQLQPAGAASYG
jgi:hypothetical protein